MKRKYCLLVFTTLLIVGCKESALLIDGSADHQIVIPIQANSIEHKAAQELQYYLFEMSKVNLPIVEEGEFTGDNAIYIGSTDFATSLDVDFNQLGLDGYAFKRQGNNFVIAGGSRKGVLYGVYDLLEFWGFRKYTSATEHIPTGNSLSLPQNDTVVVPVIIHRQIEYGDSRDPGYFDWHKLNTTGDNWGLFVHTFKTLVPPDKYLETNPEFYALRDGVRTTAQLCLSNPEVAETLIYNLRTRISERPHLRYWSVSQDDNRSPCLCDNCLELNREYGGDIDRHSGSVIYFVNKVAREFPDYMISTLAYQYTREAPDNIKPEPNVNIMLCNIESLRNKPVFDTDPAFSDDLKNWGQIAEDIILWDYNIQFFCLFSPFPNLHTIKPNLKFFTDNNVNMFFMQANRELGGEMAELRAYLISRLLWNPDADPEAIMDDFAYGYYGAAGSYIRQYIDTMRYAVIESGHQLSIFGDPVSAKNTFLSADMMEEYKRLFDEAEKAVENNPELLRRVSIARAPIMYAQLEIARTEMDNPRSLYKRDANNEVTVKPEMITLLHQFVGLCKDQGDLVKLPEGRARQVRIREWRMTPDEYLELYSRLFHRLDDDNLLSLNKKVIPITAPSEMFEPQGLQALTNGWLGSAYDHSVNWVGYEGEDMKFVLDLGEVMPITHVNMNFLNESFDNTFLPEFVNFATSVDGEAYSDFIKADNRYATTVDGRVDTIRASASHIPNQSSYARIVEIISMDNFSKYQVSSTSGRTGTFVQSYHADFNCHARFIKVHAKSILQCPPWHKSAGEPAWIFADEIVVK